ncbi:carbon-nitrogen family hydrolase [Thermotomaculum hydrothermale]|uniref:Carbon-nitrogen family hydrolase n=1 Tax=Thermotomaculum hydrothermale TaxID=981385 RepID=A0A7R6SZT8_9BACT|nr:nitrilase-related carbon-nitrogen hydrolase [Thermotomaculum hydrothermale]BBB33135.1 carbon-nitrogen family hydrolase [Thermotomaculum hydrothermale]
MKLKVGFLQFKPEFGKIKENTDFIVSELKKHKFDIAVLPELCSTGYLFENTKQANELAEDENGYFVKSLLSLAREKNCLIAGGFCEKGKDKPFNSQVLVSEKGIVSIYRKAHLFYKEKEIFERGDTPFNAVDTGKGYKVGLMICFDWIFPEAMRSLALDGAKVILHSANLVLPYCQRAMFARSLENRVFIITANRFGKEKNKKGEEIEFTGKSQIISPNGEVVLTVGRETTGLFSVEIDLKETDKNLNPLNNLFSDRRTDLYKISN